MRFEIHLSVIVDLPEDEMEDTVEDTLVEIGSDAQWYVDTYGTESRCTEVIADV